jgi:hypothetical protein
MRQVGTTASTARAEPLDGESGVLAPDEMEGVPKKPKAPKAETVSGIVALTSFPVGCHQNRGSANQAASLHLLSQDQIVRGLPEVSCAPMGLDGSKFGVASPLFPPTEFSETAWLRCGGHHEPLALTDGQPRGNMLGGGKQAGRQAGIAPMNYCHNNSFALMLSKQIGRSESLRKP